MTEYKKLVALTDLFTADVASLCDAVALINSSDKAERQIVDTVAASGTDVDPEQLFLVSSRISQSITDGCPRIRKMVLKAREVDPNRQIYNETMCGKIEELFKSFCSGLQQLAPAFSPEVAELQSSPPENEEVNANPFAVLLDNHFNVDTVLEQSPALQKAEDLHNQYILKRAKEEAWQSRVAQKLADVVTFERQSRFFIAAEEKLERVAFVEEKRGDRLRIICLLEERETAKWNDELQRRDTEQKLLHERTKSINDVAIIPSLLIRALPDTVVRRNLVGHIQKLIKALLRTPEDLNIRRLRNNNEHLMCDYGNPCLSVINSTDERQCSCASVVNAAEMLWCRMGYSIRYTNVPNRCVESMRLEKRAEELILPCGLPLSVHTYSPLGFEDYSERFFELMEPNAMETPDDWMAWYNMMQGMDHVLNEILSC
ncbi:hypothetical protein ABL78_1386 [Leptomonas seymouri]|uniref:Uncharacterized protein n=1 Tax=Leptomonas seymouri TaxID=5684 RepID=A0A0N1I0R4_LEPSE|nr:hypothetical protein ABL78_1386 [Leptomonas seymouri]|eukprot:KPI89510.1 hypothetical protein ABL78_1386 [Leptomonas seymouri]